MNSIFIKLHFIVIVLISFNIFSQEKSIEDSYLNCVYNNSNINRTNVEKQVRFFEQYLIKEKILKDNSNKAYFDLAKIILKDEERTIKYTYSFIDSINKIPNTKKLITHDKKCFNKIQKLKGYKQSTIFRLNNNSQKEHRKDVFKISDFRHKFYRLRILLTINTH